jgi:hypothetical protein
MGKITKVELLEYLDKAEDDAVIVVVQSDKFGCACENDASHVSLQYIDGRCEVVIA